MRLIDADALYDKIEERYEATQQGMRRVGHRQALFDICNAPTIDTVKHGRWIANTDDFTPAYRCSCCGYNRPMIAGDKASQWPMNYCSNCGAKMDLE